MLKALVMKGTSYKNTSKQGVRKGNTLIPFKRYSAANTNMFSFF